jgi:hypothetical protein
LAAQAQVAAWDAGGKGAAGQAVGFSAGRAKGTVMNSVVSHLFFYFQKHLIDIFSYSLISMQI